MNINAILKVRFKAERYDIAVDYNTYVKAPYDTYLITSVYKASDGDEKKIKQYIDDIAGDGSLNEHFNKLYEEVKTFDKSQIDSILKNSLFPVRETDRSNTFLYYPEFDVSQLNGQFYKGNLGDNLDAIKKILVPADDETKTFVGMKIEKDEYSSDNNILSLKNLNISSDGASFGLKGLSEPITMSLTKLESMTLDKFSTDLEDDDTWYDGKILDDATGDNWYILTDQVYDDFESYTTRFYDDDGNLNFIYPNQIETLRILKVDDGYYFYKKTSNAISKDNSGICSHALDYLVKNKKLDDFKNSEILSFLKVSSLDSSVNALNYLLSVKDSEQLSSYALDIIKSGYQGYWNSDALRKIKRVCRGSEYELLYRIDNNLDWTPKELQYVPNDILLIKDQKAKNDYLKDVDFYQKEIVSMLGEFSATGVREAAKKLGNKDQLVKDFNKSLNVYLGHNKINILTITDLDELKKHYDIIKNAYDNQYPTVKKHIEEFDRGGK